MGKLLSSRADIAVFEIPGRTRSPVFLGSAAIMTYHIVRMMIATDT
jgi:hypothetical protein